VLLRATLPDLASWEDSFGKVARVLPSLYGVRVGGGYSVVMVLALWPVRMRFRSRWRHEGLAWEDNVPGFMLLAQMVGDLRVIGLHVADESTQKPSRLKIFP